MKTTSCLSLHKQWRDRDSCERTKTCRGLLLSVEEFQCLQTNQYGATISNFSKFPSTRRCLGMTTIDLTARHTTGKQRVMRALDVFCRKLVSEAVYDGHSVYCTLVEWCVLCLCMLPVRHLRVENTDCTNVEVHKPHTCKSGLICADIHRNVFHRHKRGLSTANMDVLETRCAIGSVCVVR